MAQDDIVKILEENYPRWLTYKDIGKLVEINRSSLFRSLKKLTKWDEVEVKIEYIDKYQGRHKTYYKYKKNG